MKDYKKKYKIFKIIISLIVVSSLIFLFLVHLYSTEESINFKYKIEVTPFKNNDYVIYIPVPIMNYEMKIVKGKLSYDLINSEQGKALKIISNEKIVLEFKGEEVRYELIHDPFPDNYFCLTTQIDSNGDGKVTWRDNNNYWVYYDNSSTNNEIELSITFNHNHDSDGYCGTERFINGTKKLTGGWEILECDFNALCWDGYPIFSPFCCTISFVMEIIIIVIIILLIRRNFIKKIKMSGEQKTKQQQNL